MKKLSELGINIEFRQDNQSKSQKNVIRGLHYQLEPHAQTKLVRVFSGKILDIALDLRRDSKTFGQWYSQVLSAENHLQMLVPKGFAHGFSVLCNDTVVFYKCDEFYHPESERGIIYNDEKLEIDWKVNKEHAMVSNKDAVLPSFDEAEYNF